jgi:hypothetical protein
MEQLVFYKFFYFLTFLFCRNFDVNCGKSQNMAEYSVTVTPRARNPEHAVVPRQRRC